MNDACFLVSHVVFDVFWVCRNVATLWHWDALAAIRRQKSNAAGIDSLKSVTTRHRLLGVYYKCKHMSCECCAARVGYNWKHFGGLFGGFMCDNVSKWATNGTFGSRCQLAVIEAVISMNISLYMPFTVIPSYLTAWHIKSNDAATTRMVCCSWDMLFYLRKSHFVDENMYRLCANVGCYPKCSMLSGHWHCAALTPFARIVDIRSERCTHRFALQ